MTVARTIISIPSQDASYSIPGEFTAAQIQAMYATQIQGISNMTLLGTVDSTGPSGLDRTFTFGARAGNKG